MQKHGINKNKSNVDLHSSQQKKHEDILKSLNYDNLDFWMCIIVSEENHEILSLYNVLWHTTKLEFTHNIGFIGPSFLSISMTTDKNLNKKNTHPHVQSWQMHRLVIIMNYEW